MQKVTFRDGLQLLAVTEIECLERSTVANACNAVAINHTEAYHHCKSELLRASGRSPKPSVCRCPKVTLTFWDGLQVLAAIENEFLERRAVADSCQAVIDSG